MGKHESFKPFNENIRARDEEKERQTLDVHNRGLHDESPKNERIDEATGEVIKPSIEVGGLDEVLSEREIKADGTEDIMGAVPDALPDDAGALKRWMEKEQARLEKNKFKKAA